MKQYSEKKELSDDIHNAYFFLLCSEIEQRLKEPKMTPEQIAELKAKWNAEREANKEARKEELKKQWEEEKIRRKEERDKASSIVKTYLCRILSYPITMDRYTT